MERLILNCDLGEDEPLRITEEILSLVDAANICCGVHAGNTEKTLATIQLAQKHGVLIGAHPGLALNGGRGNEIPVRQDFIQLLEDQIGRFKDLVGKVGAQVSYIKLHGTLYHAVELDAEIRSCFLDYIQKSEPSLAVFCLSGGSLAKLASELGIRVYSEAFFDRAYLSDGSLLPRSDRRAILTLDQAVVRFKNWREQGYMPTQDDLEFLLHADTVCVHGDGAESLEMIKTIRELIHKNA